MATQERELTPRDAIHEQLMRSILKGIDDTPLVLKGGTSLMLAYGLDRFSEDLDFDAPHKLNLESRIRRSAPFGITLDGIDLLKDTSTVTRYRVRYYSEHGKRSLKLEISYRTPPQQSDVRSMHGFRVASLPRVIDQKLKAAHDGDDPRSKVRDLYDLDFVARHWPAVFTDELASRLRSFAADPDALVSRYRADYDEDDLIPNLVELDQLALRLHCASEEIAMSRAETVRRVGSLAKLERAAGAACTFWMHAVGAVDSAKAGENSAYEADWHKAEAATIRESIAENGQAPEGVADTLCMHSPGAVTAARQAAIRAEIESNAPALLAQYKARGEKSRELSDPVHSYPWSRNA